MTRGHGRWLAALLAALGLIAIPAMTAYAREFSGWSAPVNLGSTVNSAATDG